MSYLQFNLPPLPANTVHMPNRFHIPDYVYRVIHLNSANLGRYHPNIRRDNVHPTARCLPESCAIQSYRDFTLSDINSTVIRGHVNWKRSSAPYSPYISTSDSVWATKKRAYQYHSKKFNETPKLMAVIKIHTDGLVPATFKQPGSNDLLVWVSERARPKDGRSLTAQEFDVLSPELWISMSQYNDDRHSERIHFMTFQDDEWLVAGEIPQSRVVEVLPCEGPDIIRNDEGHLTEVNERIGDDTYQWHWQDLVWRRLEECRQELREHRQKRKWAEVEIELSGQDLGARAQRNEHKRMRRNSCWADSGTMTTIRADKVRQDEDKGGGGSEGEGSEDDGVEDDGVEDDGVEDDGVEDDDGGEDDGGEGSDKEDNEGSNDEDGEGQEE